MSATKTELAVYAVFAGLFLAVALPAHADDTPVQVASNADAISNQVETVVVSARRRS